MKLLAIVFFAALASSRLAQLQNGDNVCANNEDGAFIRDVDNCSVYYYCDNGVARVRECPDGLVFNTFLKVCDFEYNVNCETKPSVVPPDNACVDRQC